MLSFNMPENHFFRIDYSNVQINLESSKGWIFATGTKDELQST